MTSVTALTSSGVGLAASRSEARRKVAEGAVRIDGEKATRPSGCSWRRGRPTPCRSGRAVLRASR